ncbi:MAG TPA: hypothetical protein VGW34_04895 [Allosphingosinicella sp.]|nr:hypothetical protein [Allosphingosinicella sp.]
MSTIGDLLGAVRQVLLIQHRIDALADDLKALTAAHAETRERLIRLEVIIEEARRGAARRLGKG